MQAFREFESHSFRHVSILPKSSYDADSRYTWKVLIHTDRKGWPAGMSKAFMVKAKLDAWLTTFDVRGETYYNILYLEREADLAHFKLSWDGSQDYMCEKIR